LTFPNTTSPVYHGGPVKGIFLLHTRKDTPRSHLLGDGLFYSQINSFNSKIIRQIANTSKNYRLLMGYAEWAPGQLMTEIEKGWWFPAKCPLSVSISEKTKKQTRYYELLCPWNEKGKGRLRTRFNDLR